MLAAQVAMGVLSYSQNHAPLALCFTLVPALRLVVGPFHPSTPAEVHPRTIVLTR